MNKESIYRLIGYQGEYNTSVKKALKKLLKENHPDYKGDARIFSLINEVKKELENNQVSFKYEKSDNVIDDLDYHYCEEMLIKLQKDEEAINKLIKEKYNTRTNLLLMYEEKYHKRINSEANLLSNDSVNLKRFKYLLIMLLVILLIVFILAIYLNKIFLFIIFGIISLIIISFVYSYFNAFQTKLDKRKKLVDIYVNEIHNIKELNKQKEILNNEIVDLERKLNNIQNDLRFYKNILKYK